MDNIPENRIAEVAPRYNISRLLGIGLIGGYFIYCAINPTTWHFIDNVDLIIHEAGHFIFIFFGRFIQVMGGSILQVLIPLIFSGYFFLYRDFSSAAVLLSWAGYSLINVSVYMGDAVVQQLPLLGGDGVIHDWNYLLSSLNLLRHTQFLSSATNFIGFVIVLLGVALAIKFSLARSDFSSPKL